MPAVRDVHPRCSRRERGEIVVDAAALELAPRPPRPRGRALAAPRSRGVRADGEPSERAGASRRRGRTDAPRRRPSADPTGPEVGPDPMTLEIDVLTLFPGMLEGPLAESIPGRIQEQASRDPGPRPARVGPGRHRSVDDYPYGGGAGMVLRPEPVAAALDALRRPESTAILLDPGGERVPPGPRRGPGRDAAPHLRLPALRGRRRADPGARRPRAVDRRLRPDRRRAAGAGRHRRGPAPAARARSTPHRPSRSRSPTACSSTRSTRGRPTFRGDRRAGRSW